MICWKRSARRLRKARTDGREEGENRAFYFHRGKEDREGNAWEVKTAEKKKNTRIG